ncbi:TrmB family transcriptional regulator [Oceanotoga teriensis]|jgi:sugar-specific transcriptional regulator TrmB|uniref:Sugar-specific transcriptional regulator TrmB n=1 Tax=Oceanotoga teriensis TaxID=515440 RepID=A0AA45HHZ1_9BACT|nr:helix-turn-helix domain-containing protein [Oceanotoga teriensis]MDO7976584.1 TrmB family transcriptional regulator [Oceanotoga teriensis]PWJ88248.1 sugar-specific transcriptional regulator TrmB [Oceanotoga teriensis]
MENILNTLKMFGFTEYESKVYITLLKTGKSSGYEISKNSSVPRSKVYNILEILIKKGCIVHTKNTNPIYYDAIPINELIKNLEYKYNKALENISYELNEYNRKVDMDNMWHIEGYENTFNKCRNMIQNTKNELYLQIWEEDYKEIKEDLEKFESSGKKLLLIFYSKNHNYKLNIKNYYPHGFEDEKEKEFGGRWINIVSDSNQVIFGHIKNTKNAEVIWTESNSLIFLAKEYIKHDAYTLKIIEKFGKVLEEEYHYSDKDFRNIFEKLEIK